MKLRHVVLLFIPAIFIAVFALFVQVVQYESHSPDSTALDTANAGIQIPIFPDDPISGNKRAPITIVAFEDLGCDGCYSQHEVLKQLLERYPDRVKVVWKLLTVTQYPYSTDVAHQYAYCANRQGQFADFVDRAFTNRYNLAPRIIEQIAEQVPLDERKLASCLADEQSSDYLSSIESLARSLNIQVVPRLFLNNTQVHTPNSVEQWESLLGLDT